MEKECEAKQYLVFLYCDNCGTEMKQGKNVLCTNPPMFEYTCPKCGHKETNRISYPYTRFKPIEEDHLPKSKEELVIDNSDLWKIKKEDFQIIKLEPLKNGVFGKILEWEDGEWNTLREYNGWEQLDYERDVERFVHNSKVIIVK